MWIDFVRVVRVAIACVGAVAGEEVVGDKESSFHELRSISGSNARENQSIK